MRNPKNVLNSLSKHSGNSNYKFERLYRVLFNAEMFYVAYERIYAKPGNMTAGTDGKTVSGMSIERIEQLIESLKTRLINQLRPKGVHTEEKRQETSAWHPLIQRQVGAGSGENDTGSYLRGQF